MATYMVGYDLNRSGQNYDGLIAKIKELADGYWHHLDSTWIINSTRTASQVRDALQPYLDSNDELLVCAVGAPGAWTGFNNSGSEWLKANLR